MGKLRIAPGGGGTDLDVITATAADLVAPKVIVDQNGDPVTGTLPNKSGWNGSVGMNSDIIVPYGKHDGLQKVKGPVVTQRGAPSYSLPINGTQNLPEGYYTGGKVSQSIPTLGAQTINPQTYAQTVSSSGKYMTGNVAINGVALPPAAALKKGYRYWIGNNYVDGNFEGYVSSPLYLYNNGAWSNLQTPGMTYAAQENNYLNCGADKVSRLNQTVDLTNYKYLKIYGRNYTNKGGWFQIGVTQKPSAVENDITIRTSINTDSSSFVMSILDISNLSGFYYICVYGFAWIMSSAGGIVDSGKVNQILLSTT